MTSTSLWRERFDCVGRCRALQIMAFVTGGHAQTIVALGGTKGRPAGDRAAQHLTAWRVVAGR